MPSKSSQPFMNRHTYIPPHVQQAMERQMQRTMPANLRKYTEGNSYIPQHAERAIAQHMEKTMPGQFKKYAGSYVQQKVMSQHVAIASAMPQAAPSPAMHSAAPNLLPQDHFQSSEEQQPVQQTAAAIPGSTIHPGTVEQFQAATPAQPEPSYPVPPNPGQPLDPAQAPMYPGVPTQPAAPQPQAYDFITDPAQPERQSRLPSLPGVGPTAMRAAIIGGGLFALLIIFIIIKGLIGGGSSLTPFLGVAQDQQELIHLATTASLQQGITTGDQNFAATTALSLTSAQAGIVNYLASNGKKVNPKLLSLKISATTDAQLTAAAAATTYDQTFQEVMKTKLTAYLSGLQQTYKQTSGKKGRTLLNDDYAQAQLLLTQLNAPSQ